VFPKREIRWCKNGNIFVLPALRRGKVGKKGGCSQGEGEGKSGKNVNAGGEIKSHNDSWRKELTGKEKTQHQTR